MSRNVSWLDKTWIPTKFLNKDSHPPRILTRKMCMNLEEDLWASLLQKRVLTTSGTSWIFLMWDHFSSKFQRAKRTSRTYKSICSFPCRLKCSKVWMPRLTIIKMSCGSIPMETIRFFLKSINIQWGSRPSWIEFKGSKELNWLLKAFKYNRSQKLTKIKICLSVCITSLVRIHKEITFVSRNSSRRT